MAHIYYSHATRARFPARFVRGHLDPGAQVSQEGELGMKTQHGGKRYVFSGALWGLDTSC